MAATCRGRDSAPPCLWKAIGFPRSLPFWARLRRPLTQDGHSEFGWQPRFYDHGVEDEDSLNEIREYIGNNPKRWEMKRKLQTAAMGPRHVAANSDAACRVSTNVHTSRFRRPICPLSSPRARSEGTVKKIDSICTGDPVWSPAAESSGFFLAPLRSASTGTPKFVWLIRQVLRRAAAQGRPYNQSIFFT